MDKSRDNSIEHYLSLQQNDYTYLVRFDLRLYHPIESTELDWILELWFCPRDKSTGTIFDYDPHRLKIICFGVDIIPLKSLPLGALYLSIEAIKDWQWQGISYKVVEIERGTLFYCKNFKASIEEITVE